MYAGWAWEASETLTELRGKTANPRAAATVLLRKIDYGRCTEDPLAKVRGAFTHLEDGRGRKRSM